jgi:hypothetical protein
MFMGILSKRFPKFNSQIPGVELRGSLRKRYRASSIPFLDIFEDVKNNKNYLY